MTDRDALLAAVLAHPEEDTPRLVYADWLQENGGARGAARAEFIRVQVELSKLPSRLVYADWLQENGGARGAARAEFIRVQVELSKLPSLRTPGVPLSSVIPHMALEGGTDEQRAVVMAGLNRAAELQDRETALLKKWGAGWLPKSLRPRHARPLFVSGPTVPIDREMGFDGYVRFERGFIAHAGCELPWRPDEATSAVYWFAGHLRAIFAANPLTGFTVSFEGSSGEALTAEITTESPDRWRLMWDANTYNLLTRDMIPQPLTAASRSELGQRFALWLMGAVREPAAAVAALRALEQALGVDVGPDFIPVPDDESDIPF